MKYPVLIYLPVGNLDFKMENRIVIDRNRNINDLKEGISDQLERFNGT